jgi:broad specificity phosphatase PhoE
MTRLILIRHGETDWNVEGRWQGQSDVPLNAHGRQQALEIANSYIQTDIAAIYSSDLKRALETAQTLADLKGLQIHVDKRLREIHQGEWQGLLITEIRARYADLFVERMNNPLQVAPPGGETLSDLKERILDAIYDIINNYPRQTVAIVSHGFALAFVRTHFCQLPVEKVWELVPETGKGIAIEVGQDTLSRPAT